MQQWRTHQWQPVEFKRLNGWFLMKPNRAKHLSNKSTFYLKKPECRRNLGAQGFLPFSFLQLPLSFPPHSSIRAVWAVQLRRMNNTIKKWWCTTERGDATAAVQRNINTASMSTRGGESQVELSHHQQSCNTIICLHLLYETPNTSGWVLMSLLFTESQVASVHMCERERYVCTKCSRCARVWLKNSS